MNAVYSVVPRLDAAVRWGQEKLGRRRTQEQAVSRLPQTASLAQYYKAPDTVWTARILKDGADSVGVLGALNRVFINIGLFSEEWLLHFNPLVGGKSITPIKIEDAEKNSSYWNATVAQTAVRSGVLSQNGEARLAQGRSRRREVSVDGPGPARLAASRFSPRPARAAIQARFPKRRRMSMNRTGSSTGMDQNRRLQEKDDCAGSGR